MRTQGREVNGAHLAQDLVQDLRFAARQLRRHPSFTFTVVAVFALAIGSSAAIFAFVDAVLVKPLPYRDPSRLVALYERIPVGERYHLSDYDYHAWKERNRVFSTLDVYRPDRFRLDGGASPEEVSGAIISDGFFSTLGIAPLLGRDFRHGEDLPSAPRVVILSYESWQRRFGANQNILGSTVSLNGDPFLVVGVMPPGFHFAPVGQAEFWILLRGLCDDNHGCFPYYGVARLKDGVSAASALDNLTSIARQIAVEFPQYNKDRSAVMIPLSDAILGDIRPILIALLGGAGLLTLIGFVNISSLLLVRAESRRREMAVRGALGASRVRLVRQFVVEGFLLAASGWALGMLLTATAIKVLAGAIPANLLHQMPYLQGLGFNSHLLIFAAMASIAGGMLCSAGPALYLLRSDMQKDLAEGGRSSAGRGWRRLGANLVALELAITVVLLVGAGLLTKSLYRLLHVDMGIAADHLAMVHVTSPGPWQDDKRNIALERQVVAAMSTLPGVTSTGVSGELNLASGERYKHMLAHFHVKGRSYTGLGDEAVDQMVGAGYFETLKVRLVAGRYFTEADDGSKQRVAIINRTMAKQVFPDEDPLGKYIIDQYDKEHPLEIVGVVDDLKDGALDLKSTAAVYSPFNQIPTNEFYVSVRTSQSERAVLPSMIQALHQIDRGLIADEAETMADRIDNSQTAYLHRAAAWVVAGFASLALLLGTVGVYGVISYSVSQRRREIGVRMALGAQRSAVYRLVLKEAGWLALFGIAGGMVCSLPATSLLRSMLFGVSRGDVGTLLTVAATLAVSALLASFLPAHRAASIDPTEALRAE